MPTIYFGDYEWDDKKDQFNRSKHGLPLALASKLLPRAWHEEIDRDNSEKEERWIAYCPFDENLLVCVYTVRRQRQRIISLRKATNEEKRKIRARL